MQYVQDVKKFNLRKITEKISRIYLIIAGFAFAWFFFGAIIWGGADFGVFAIPWLVASHVVLLITLVDLPRRPRSKVSFLAYGIALIGFYSITSSLTVGAAISGNVTQANIMGILPFILFAYGIVFLVVPFGDKSSDVVSK